MIGRRWKPSNGWSLPVLIARAAWLQYQLKSFKDSLFTCIKFIDFPGAHTGGETPVPIPNTVVKPSRADGTGRLPAWESRSVPGVFYVLKFFQPLVNYLF